VIILAGNQSDKIYECEVSKEEGAVLARKFNCEFIETSAKTAQNVDRLFMNVVRVLRQQDSGDMGPKVGKCKKNNPKCIIM
jgi:GTPase KRas